MKMIPTDISISIVIKKIIFGAGKLCKHISLSSLILFLISILMMYSIIKVYNVKTDITLHITMLYEYLHNNTGLNVNILFYFVVYFVSFLSKDYDTLLYSALLILSLSMIFKYIVTKVIIEQSVENKQAHISFFSIILFFSFSLPSISFFQNGFMSKYAMGYFPQNVWHNSTITFLYPFALLLFWSSYKQLIQPTYKRMLWITVLCVINALIKPSFLLCFIIVFPMYFIILHRFSKITYLNFLPPFISIIVIFIQYLLRYMFEFENTAQIGESNIVIAPFSVWAHWLEIKYIPISIIFSFFFPLVFYIIYKPKQISMLYKMTLTYVIVGLLIYIFFSESGYRKFHANFNWQNIIISYIFMLVTVIELLKIEQTNSMKRIKIFSKYNICMIALILHFSSGILYLFKMIHTGYVY